MIATGGWPWVPDIPGKECIVTSNEMFSLARLPKRLLIVGGGYIALEFAGIMQGFGVKTTLAYRGELLLRGFDHDVRRFVVQEMRKKSIDIRFNTQIIGIEKTDHGLLAHTGEDQSIGRRSGIVCNGQAT